MATALQPGVEVGCGVCGAAAHVTICAAAEVRAQIEYLQRFHRARLRPRQAVSPQALADRADFTQDYVTNVVACSGCGVVYRDPRPKAADIARAYAADHYGRDRLDALFSSQSELFRRHVRELRRWLGPGRKIVVEIGSFVGGFLAAGQEQGWTTIGVDPGQEVTDFCRAKGLTVVRDCAELASLHAPARADCVAIWNTLDQLPDPDATLAVTIDLLRPGGVLALRVPNGACFRYSVELLRRWPRPLRDGLRAAMAWNNLLAFPYLHGYTPRTLDWLMARHRCCRLAMRPDTLPRLADADTKRWALCEERMLKVVWRLLAQSVARRSGGAGGAPWLDAYYRLTQPDMSRITGAITSPSRSGDLA